jgi:hypothetical protein
MTWYVPAVLGVKIAVCSPLPVLLKTFLAAVISSELAVVFRYQRMEKSAVPELTCAVAR